MLCGLLAAETSGKAGTALAAPGDIVPAQAVACPTYWPPEESFNWDPFTNAAPASAIAIINWEVTTSYTDDFVRDLQSKGLIVIAYVSTDYMATGVAAVEGIVDDYYAAYPTLDGIFFDETINTWTSSSNSYYTQLHGHVKSKSGKRIVVFNFGTQHDEPFMDICDISLNKETTWSGYNSWSGLSGSAWEWGYPPNRFWHLVYGCPSSNMAAAVSKSKENNAGYVFVTDVSPDPWDAIPSYWSSERDEVQAMSRWHARNDATNLYYRIQFQNNWDYKRVFIDADRVSTTGFQYAGVGSEYLIENSGLYIYTGTGSDWRWSLVRNITVTDETNPNAISWTLFQSDLGSTTATDLVFEVARSGGFTKTGYRYRHAYSAADGGIINYGEENDSAKLYFNADFAFAWTWNQVFIDDDSSASTGYQIGDAGCEWLIENDDLYKYTGNGTTWSWSSGILEADGNAAAHHTVDGTVHEWWVWRNTVDEQRFDKDNNRLILRGHTGPPLYQTPMYDFETSP
ncbi:MAG: spherulation-specific family 4 protein [Candidatus Polarisedimenticolia bacterium]